MSFATQARRVRDESLPLGARVRALGSCVQLYRPFGFRATHAFLEHAVGRYARNPAALCRALDILTASREEWKKAASAHAIHRRAAKSRGVRRPPRAAVTRESRPQRRNPGSRPLLNLATTSTEDPVTT